MLASRLTPAAPAPLLPLLQSSKTATSTSILRSMNSSRSPQRQQQSRDFRLVFCLEPGSLREQGRHRILKSKNVEAINRRLLLNRHTTVRVGHSSIKTFMCSPFHERKSMINLQKLRQDSSLTTINLARGNQGSFSDSPKAGTNRRKGRRFSNDGAQLSNLEYDIDPTTNWKIFKYNISANAFKGHKSPFSKFESPGAQHLSKQPAKSHLGPATLLSRNANAPYITDSELYPDGRTLKEELDVYQPFQHNEPDGHLTLTPDPVEEALNEYDQKWKPKPFRYNEPDGHFPPAPDPVKEALSEYDQKWEPKPFRYNEPDGHFPPAPDPVKEALSEYDQKWEPKPFRYNEPDGHFPPAPDPVKEALSEYDQKWEPKPFRYNEPDGHFPPAPNPVKEALSEYDQKWEPKPFRYNEPDGHFPPAPDPVKEALSEYDQKWEPKPFRYNEPDGHFPPTKDPTKEALSEYDQKWDPKPFRYNEPDGHFPLTPDPVKEALSEYDQKREPKPFRYNEPDGHFPLAPDPVKEALSEYDQKWEPQPQNNNFFFNEDDKSGHLTQPKSSISRSSVIPVATSWKSDGGALMPKNAQSETATKCSSKTRTRPVSEFFRKPNTPRLEPSLERHQAVPLDTSYPQDLYSKDPVGLEASYAKECAEQGNPEPPIYVSSYGVGLPRAAKVVSQTSHAGVSKRKAKPEETVRQKAIDTQHRQPIDHLCAATKTSAVPKSKEHQPSKEPKNALPAQSPTFYKILAYDPDTQSILTTETASIVPPDAQMPLSPATVLLRLSKPAKFLPHVAPLLKEGYEIASGNGGVLVFRKVRDGPPSMPPAVKFESHAPVRKMTNPIDGMQSIRPATGNFASPTGFVNHDLPEHQPEPFKSGIDVRREERIFSGRGSGWQDQETREKDTRNGKGKRAKRLLIGAAWVGGLTYAAGIVTEFFRTGGIDGKGPAGL